MHKNICAPFQYVFVASLYSYKTRYIGMCTEKCCESIKMQVPEYMYKFLCTIIHLKIVLRSRSSDGQQNKAVELRLQGIKT